jgi:hypothetical protein
MLSWLLLGVVPVMAVLGLPTVLPVLPVLPRRG